MSNYRFELNGNDITDDILGFNYSENWDDVASSFSFESLSDFGITSINASGDEQINAIRIFEKGQTEPFYVGVITDYEHTNDVNKYSYSGFDVGFYLNKNEVIIQYNNENIADAIKKLCKNYGINVNIPNFTKKVEKIYKDVIFSDIIKELIQLEHDKGGLKDLYIDCKNGVLNIYRYQIEQGLTAVIGNGFLVSSDETYSNVSTKMSIQELKNRVVYTNNNEKSTYSVRQEKAESINTFGLLTVVESVDTNKNNDLKKLAQSKLDELNKVKEEISLSCLGDYRISKGKLIDFTTAKYGLSGIYLVKSATHTIDDKKEVVSVNIAHLNS